MNHAHSWSEEGPKQGQHSVLPLLTPGIKFLCDFFFPKPKSCRLRDVHAGVETSSAHTLAAGSGRAGHGFRGLFIVSL